ncbi:unnamed protein product [Toxocara canis]|uniref:Uncharacterized protein n=1 Tax=Toxocara canis TaxID=6265 RepID=A0A3P7H4J7_TOXCA|nr:unnamed protein product [Toxocara canis]
MTSLTSSLNVTMVITLRKFLSLALSIYVFENPFKWMHATGTTLVLIGTLLFTDINYDTSSLWRRLSRRASAEKCD